MLVVGVNGRPCVNTGGGEGPERGTFGSVERGTGDRGSVCVSEKLLQQEAQVPRVIRHPEVKCSVLCSLFPKSYYPWSVLSAGLLTRPFCYRVVT